MKKILDLIDQELNFHSRKFLALVARVVASFGVCIKQSR